MFRLCVCVYIYIYIYIYIYSMFSRSVISCFLPATAVGQEVSGHWFQSAEFSLISRVRLGQHGRATVYFCSDWIATFDSLSHPSVSRRLLPCWRQVDVLGSAAAAACLTCDSSHCERNRIYYTYEHINIYIYIYIYLLIEYYIHI